MKVLLRRTGSGLFFKDLESWVQDEAEARNFTTALNAIQFCELHGIAEAQIIMRGGKPEEDILLGPIDSQSPARRPSL
jgi:hypothetical protein